MVMQIDANILSVNKYLFRSRMEEISEVLREPTDM